MSMFSKKANAFFNTILCRKKIKVTQKGRKNAIVEFDQLFGRLHIKPAAPESAAEKDLIDYVVLTIWVVFIINIIVNNSILPRQL